jgi:hypothetical protein
MRAAPTTLAAAAVALAFLSGGSGADPRTPAPLPGQPPPFLGTAVAGDGGLTAAIDAYGDVVDLRAPGPAGRALIDNPADRQAAGSVAADTGIVPRVAIGGGPAMPLWHADSVSQRYLPGTNVVRTAARFRRVRVAVSEAVAGQALAVVVEAVGPRGTRAVPQVGVSLDPGAGCEREQATRRLAMVCDAGRQAIEDEAQGGRGSAVGRLPASAAPTAVAPATSESTDGTTGSAAPSVNAAALQLIRAAADADRRWLARARPLGQGAPGWARRMYARSLLTLRALIDRRTGAAAAGARDGWAYVWPRDAATAALALSAAGYRGEARRIAGFLSGLDLGAAARFHGNGSPVPRRGAQGDAAGWVAAATRATGLPSPSPQLPWRDRPDYREGPPNNYLANAIGTTAAAADGPKSHPYRGKSAHRRGGVGAFATPRGLVRQRGAGLDSAAAWAVRPFALPALFPAARRTMLRLVGEGTRFGITPGEDWPGTDPWMAPTAWTAWSLAALAAIEGRSGGRFGGQSTTPSASTRGSWRREATARVDRRQALHLLADLRRAATPAGALPERVDARSGIPRSTTPLAWPHAFAILALRELWPPRRERHPAR